MLPPQDTINAIGYIKRVIIHPDFQGQGLAQQLRRTLSPVLAANISWPRLTYTSGNRMTLRSTSTKKSSFEQQHRELYYKLRL